MEFDKFVSYVIHRVPFEASPLVHKGALMLRVVRAEQLEDQRLYVVWSVTPSGEAPMLVYSADVDKWWGLRPPMFGVGMINLLGAAPLPLKGMEALVKRGVGGLAQWRITT